MSVSFFLIVKHLHVIEMENDTFEDGSDNLHVGKLTTSSVICFAARLADI